MASPALRLPASPFALAREAARARRLVNALRPGSRPYALAYRRALALGMADLGRRVAGGATPTDVAAYVLRAGMVGGALSRAIEDVAHPGTLAEAVFGILAD